MTNFIKDPAPGITPGDGSQIRTDMHNEMADRLGLARPTADRVIVSDASGFYIASTITTTKLGFLSDVTSALQAQIDGKSAIGHTHLLTAITDVTMTVANLNSLDDGLDSTLHFHASDRARANHSGTQDKSTISGLPWAKADLPSSIAYEDEINDFTTANRFATTGLEIWNPAKTFKMRFASAAVAADINMNLPLLTANDTIVFAGFPQTITQKTFNLTNNFVQDSFALGDLVKADGTNNLRKFAKGAANTLVKVNAGGTDSIFELLKTANIDASQVTYAKIQNVSATSRILGRITAAAGDIEELTGTQATTLLDVFTSTLKGLAPLSGGGTTNFLRADGTWALPPSASGASLTRIAGASGAAGADFTVQNLTADSADVTTTALSASIMTTTGLGAGTWKFRYTLICQGDSTTIGIGFGVNHTGTATLLQAIAYSTSTGGTAATGTLDNDTATVGGQMMEGKSENALNVVIGSTFAGWGAVDANHIVLLEGILVVTVSGNLELKIATETGGTAVRVMADSCLELVKIE